MKLFPGENIRPLPLGLRVKAFHPQTPGVVHFGIIRASAGSTENTIKTCRYQVQFDVTGRKRFWIGAQDIVQAEFPVTINGVKCMPVESEWLSRVELEEEAYKCDSCGRPESSCSADPCAGVIADRKEQI